MNYITQEEIDDFAPEYFFHLAATFERSVETYDFWYENHKHNTSLGTHLMTLMKDSHSLKKMVNCSSYLIYEPNLYYFDEPAVEAYSLDEDVPINPRNLTGAAKLYHEIELRFLNEFNRHQYKCVSARIFRSYGKNSRDIVSRWIRMLLQGETLTVYKKEGLFDYVYAGNVAEGLVRLAVNEEAEGIFNLATGKAQRVTEILDVLKLYFPDMKTIEEDVDIPYEGSQANMEKYESLMGWKPSMRLSDAIPLMIEYEKNYGYQHDGVSDTNIMITSLSRKVPLAQAVKRAAQKIGAHAKVHGADLNHDCLGRHFTDGFWQMPPISEISINQIIAYCKDHHITAIIPTRDGELAFWSAQKQALEQSGIAVMVSDRRAVDLCVDKLLFYESPILKGFPIIPTSKDIDNINSDLYVVKEQFGAGAHHVEVKLDKAQALACAKAFDHPIFQPFIEGHEASVDLYVTKSHDVKGVVLRTRDTVVDGESQITTTFQEPQLKALCTELALKMGLYGHVIFQALQVDDGSWQIIECNCRFGGASTLSIEVGLDSFYWFILEANGEDIRTYPFLQSEKQVRQIRYPKDHYQIL